MSGHSHWAGIKHKKALQDAKRAQIFTKLGRAITIAARSGGANNDFNPALRLAIEKAKEFNMPKDRIDSLIKKGSGKGEGAELEETRYEALGPFGIMIIISVITDNKNRTVSELRRILEKHGGKMADGGVSWNFKRAGIINLSVSPKQREEAEDIAIENGADDIIEKNSSTIIIHSPLENFNKLKKKLARFSIGETSVGYIPQNPIPIGPEVKEKYENLVEELTEHPDVQEVFDNTRET